MDGLEIYIHKAVYITRNCNTDYNSAMGMTFRGLEKLFIALSESIKKENEALKKQSKE